MSHPSYPAGAIDDAPGEGTNSAPSFLEKILDDLAAFLFPDSRHNLRLMIQARIGDHIVNRTRSSGPGIGSPKYKPLYSCVNNCARAHHTWFHRAVKCQPGQSIVSKKPGSSSHGNDFGVRSR